MTRKLPADKPSAEELGASRPDVSSVGVDLSNYGGEPVNMIDPDARILTGVKYQGILGVETPNPDTVISASLIEVERRILNIEACIRKLQEIVQP